jgi:hypothetical protein
MEQGLDWRLGVLQVFHPCLLARPLHVQYAVFHWLEAGTVISLRTVMFFFFWITFSKRVVNIRIVIIPVLHQFIFISIDIYDSNAWSPTLNQALLFPPLKCFQHQNTVAQHFAYVPYAFCNIYIPSPFFWASHKVVSHISSIWNNVLFHHCKTVFLQELV